MSLQNNTGSPGWRLLRQPALWGAGTYGALIYLILPPEVIVVNDDFGYLRSVIETIRHGRPWTGDWLEPWAASLAVLSALVFKITGSMHTATSGLQALFAAAAVGGAVALFRGRGLSVTASLLFAGLVISIPTLLWKSIEYTAMTLYLPCLLWAIWAAERRRWGWFFLAWFVAFSSRQSAIVWLALPLGGLVRCFWRSQPSAARGTWWHPALVLAGAAAAYAALTLGMNKTQSQLMVTDHIWEHINPAKSWQSLEFGVGAFLGMMGIGAFVLGWRRDGPAQAGLRPWKVFSVLAGAGLFLLIWNLNPLDLYFEHGSYGGVAGRSYIMLLMAVALAGWLTNGFAVRVEAILAAAGGLALVCLRTDVWDYYFLDVALFGLFAPVVRPGFLTSERPAPWPKAAVVAIGALFVSYHLYFAFQLKLSMDRGQALCLLAEKSLRNDSIKVTELSFAPFGFIGWHLHPHFLAHSGKTDPDIGGFMRYLQHDAIEARFSPLRFWRDSRSLQPDRTGEGEDTIASEVFPAGWLWYQRCSLRRNPVQAAQPSALAFDPADYRPCPLPLNREEWRREIESAGP